jgi:hypothetical protein
MHSLPAWAEPSPATSWRTHFPGAGRTSEAWPHAPAASPPPSQKTKTFSRQPPGCVTYFAVSDDFTGRKPGGVPFGVIRQRARGDHQFPDLGQILTWQLRWPEVTPVPGQDSNR